MSIFDVFGHDGDFPTYEEFHKSKERAMQQKSNDYQVGGTHYKNMAIEPWDVMEAVLTREEYIGFLKGNLIKYAMRQGHKPDSDDAAKAKHYRMKLKEVQE